MRRLAESYYMLSVFCICVCMISCSVVSNSLQLYELLPARLFCPWDSPGKNPEVGCHFLLQGIFPTQGSNSCLLHWQVNSSPLSHLGCFYLCLNIKNSCLPLLSFDLSPLRYS